MQKSISFSANFSKVSSPIDFEILVPIPSISFKIFFERNQVSFAEPVVYINFMKLISPTSGEARSAIE